MTTDDKLTPLIVAIRMSLEQAQGQSELNAMQCKLNNQLLELVEAQQNAIIELRERLDRIEVWRQN